MRRGDMCGVRKIALVLFALFGQGCIPAVGEVSIYEFSEGPSQIASELARSLGRQDVGRLAVLPFPDSYGRELPLSRWLSSELVSALASIGGLDVIERDQLNQLLDEAELSASGLMDSNSVARIGRLLGADTLVIGSIVVENSSIGVVVRAVAVETGVVLSPAGVRISRSSVPENLLAPVLGLRAPDLKSQANVEVLDVWRYGAFEVVVVGISRTKDRRRVSVDIQLRNQTVDELLIGIEKGPFGRCSAWLTDDQGLAILPIGDQRGVAVSCVTKSAARTSFTHLPEFSTTPLTMNFEAKKGEEINGTEFDLNLNLVFHTEQGRKPTLAGFTDLRLED